MANRIVELLWRWSDEGRLPVVCDSSPCAHTLKQGRLPLRERLRVLDGIELATERVVPALAPTQRASIVALHPVCSVRKMDLAAEFEALARVYARETFIALAAGCCGFAGDRGFAVPELTAAATRGEAVELAGLSFDGHYASSTTCEIGLSRATGRPWRSFWHLIEQTTR
jgi:D-lactate dehydrogenase